MRINLHTVERDKLTVKSHDVESHTILMSRNDKINQIELLGSVRRLIDRIAKEEGGFQKRVIVIEIED